MALSGYLPLIDKLPFGVGMYGMFALVLIQGCQGTVLTRAGAIRFGGLIPWERIDSWEWLRSGKCRLHPAGTPWQRFVGPRHWTFSVPPNLRASVEAILREHVPSSGPVLSGDAQ